MAETREVIFVEAKFIDKASKQIRGLSDTINKTFTSSSASFKDAFKNPRDDISNLAKNRKDMSSFLSDFSKINSEASKFDKFSEIIGTEKLQPSIKQYGELGDRINNIGTEIKGFQAAERAFKMPGLFSQDINTLLKERTKLQNKQTKILSDLNSDYATYNDRIKTAVTANKQFTEKQKKIGEIFKNVQNGLLSVGLAALFTGMAIRNFLNNLAISTVKTFQEISGENNLLNQNIAALSASWTFLKYSVGEAISSFIAAHPEIIALITSFANWISNNKDLIGGLIIVGLVLSTILMVFGQFALAILGIVGGIASLIGLFGGTSTAAAGAGTAVSAVGVTFGAVFATVLIWVGVVIAAVIALWAAWKTNLGNIQGFAKSAFTNIIGVFKELFSKVTGIFIGVIEVIKGIFSGDLQTVLTGLYRIVATAIVGIVNIFLRLGGILYDISLGTINLLKDLIINVVSLIVQTFIENGKNIVKLWNALLPDRLGLDIDLSIFDTANTYVKDFADSIKEITAIPPSSGFIDTATKFVDDLLLADIPNLLGIDLTTSKPATQATADSLIPSIGTTPQTTVIDSPTVNNEIIITAPEGTSQDALQGLIDAALSKNTEETIAQFKAWQEQYGA